MEFLIFIVENHLGNIREGIILGWGHNWNPEGLTGLAKQRTEDRTKLSSGNMHPSPELFPLQHTGLHVGSESTPNVVTLGRGNFGHSLYFACLGRNGGRVSFAKCNPANLWHVIGNIFALLIWLFVYQFLFSQKGTESTTQISLTSSCPSVFTWLVPKCDELSNIMGGWGTQLGVRQGSCWVRGPSYPYKEGVSTCFSHLCSQGFMVMLFPSESWQQVPF